ncbi:hypothetical protein [Labilibacter marinus]|uniref:hypothetical protein n=1 Tax=Labilibacter marinus TaxID=1477105 RepID=UPI00094F9F5F|nr:hypothetical protein [Labilibacter marinus]
MSNNQLLYLKFFLRTTKKNPEKGMLYLRISYNTKRVDFSFNQPINVNSWNSASEVVKASEKEYQRINRSIASARSKILSIFDKLRFEEKLITPLILRNYYLGNVDKGKTLLEWIEKDPFTRYKLSFKKTERTFLTEKELNVIVNKNFNNQRMEFVRDMFVFACYTGMAYIDVMQLRPENINIGIDGEYWISTKRKKTEVDLNIP